jgi:hypothetical protein
MDFLIRLQRSGRWAKIQFDQYGNDWTGHLDFDARGIAVAKKALRPWNEVVQIADRYDAAIALGNHSPAQLPSKAVQYLTLPIPRIAVTSGKPNDALAHHAVRRPGWAVVSSMDPTPAPKVAEHLARRWDEASLEPPAEDAWPVVAAEIAEFVNSCLTDEQSLPAVSQAIL